MIRTFAIALILTPHLALADTDAAEVCAETLAPDAQLIFDEVYLALDHAPDRPAQSVARDIVFELALSGQINGQRARSNAIAAADCLRFARADSAPLVGLTEVTSKSAS